MTRSCYPTSPSRANALETHGFLEQVGLTKPKPDKPQQAVLTGQWDEEGYEKKQYVPRECLHDLLSQRLIYQDGTWDNGEPRYQVTGKSQPLVIVKTFKGKGRAPEVSLRIPEGDPPQGMAAPTLTESEDGTPDSALRGQPAQAEAAGGDRAAWVAAIAMATDVCRGLPQSATNEEILKVAITTFIEWHKR